jgi:hypothetical protein
LDAQEELFLTSHYYYDDSRSRHAQVENTEWRYEDGEGAVRGTTALARRMGED